MRAKENVLGPLSETQYLLCGLTVIIDVGELIELNEGYCEGSLRVILSRYELLMT